MIFFFISRSVFVLYNLDEINEIGFVEILSTFGHALYLDNSFACYLLGFSVLMMVLSTFIPGKVIHYVHSAYVILLLIVLSFITIAELEIYNEWGSKLTVKAIRFLQQPAEVFHSTSLLFLAVGFLAVGLLVYIGFAIWKKLCPAIYLLRENNKNISWVSVLSVLFFTALMPVLLVIGLRGGLQEIPIQQSDAYFSKHNVLNLAAVNSGWNLGQSIWENKKNMGTNPYDYFPLPEATQTVNELYSVAKDSTISVLKTNRPNIVLIILESWSADLVKSLGGYDSITPGLDKIISEGVLFENAYASGSLSDQGMAAIFSAFPAQPTVSIISQPGKYVKLPCLNTELKEKGYSTSFLFGGQLSYGNIKAYMYYNNFDRILEGVDFSSNIPAGRLGVHDEYVYARQLELLKNEKEPFFASMFTLSSHSPYDMPMKKEDRLAFDSDEANYVNSVHYADDKLFDFLQKSKNEKWFDNTLFVIVADHSHRSPKHWSMNQPEYRRIPMVFWGNVIKEEYRGYENKKICSQTDLAATLFSQLEISSTRFEWSKNVFNPSISEFAYFETTDGFGWVRPNQYLVYSHQMDHYYFEKTNSAEEKNRLEKEGKSFLQVLYQKYTDY